MRTWFRRKHQPKGTSVGTMGGREARVHSGTLLVCDPMGLSGGIQVTNVPAGDHPVVAQVISYAEGGKRLAGIKLAFTTEVGGVPHKIGEVDVESASVAVLDNEACEQFWQEQGNARLGIIASPEHRHIAKLLNKRFQLESRPVNAIRSELVEPVSEELEAEIVAYRKTFPNYAAFPFMFFRIETRNTRELLRDALAAHGLYCQMVLDRATRANVFLFQSGFGDGTYPVLGRQIHERLGDVAVEFIGPAQDKILEAFPLLRY